MRVGAGVGASVVFLGGSGAEPVPPENPELVTNGTFDGNLNGWDVNGSATWANPGVAVVADVEGADGYIAQSIVAEVGETYVMSFDVLAMVGGSAASARVRFGANAGSATDGDVLNMGGLGHNVFEFVAAREEQWFTVLVSTTDASRTFDNISIKKKVPAVLTAGEFQDIPGYVGYSDGSITGATGSLDGDLVTGQTTVLVTYAPDDFLQVAFQGEFREQLLGKNVWIDGVEIPIVEWVHSGGRTQSNPPVTPPFPLVAGNSYTIEIK